tara:strand:+ start:246 stop:581 length:336 start_codon:yes stop_codon:yes gene_type:complete
MGRKVSGGKGKKATESDHLAQVAKQLGKELADVEQANADAIFPDVASHLWATFIELHDGRTYGMSGPNPISYDIIKAWCDITGVDLSPWEVTIIKSLDNLWIKITSEEDNG